MSKINKHRRLGKILQTLERWAPLETSEVSQNLANIFAVEESEIRRNVVNDLKFLRDEGELIPLYYNKFGELISKEIEPEDGTFYRVKWQLRSQEGQTISGSHELSQYGSFINASKEIREKLSIRQGMGNNPCDWYYFYFDLNNELYHLAIPKDVISSSNETKVVIGLCRSQPTYPNDLERDFNFLSIKYPHASCILISFKEPFLSSADGHIPITIEFSCSGKIHLNGQENKNPLFFMELPEGKAKNLLTYLSLFRDKTQTTHWTEIKKEEDMQYRENSGRDLCSPLLLKLKENVGFLVQ